MIVGLGTDIIEIVRIGRMVERHGEVFLTRVYTDDEIRYCQRRKECFQHYAGRWAVKEAVMKTLGTGWIRGIRFRDIEVVMEKSGKPTLRIHGGVREYAEKLNIGEFLISISHCREYATATAIALHKSGTAAIDKI
ncbi:MAG: holo-ACP synthase [Planctomycetaceae bacterium]